jgi:hypothetical protein
VWSKCACHAAQQRLYRARTSIEDFKKPMDLAIAEQGVIVYSRNSTIIASGVVKQLSN